MDDLDYIGEDDFDDWFEDLWEADLEPPHWVVEKLIPSGLTFMVAPPKSYKSTVLMSISLAVAGERKVGLPEQYLQVPEPGIVMGLSAEASPGELLYMVQRGMGVTDGKHGAIRLLHDPWRFRLDDPGARDTLLQLLRAKHPRLLWIDPLRDFHSLEETDAGEMNRLLRPLQRWAKEHDSAVVIVHHTRKRSMQDPDKNLRAEDARGTGALFGMADCLITCTPKGKNRVHFDVVPKRGEPWEETLTLAIWGENEAHVMIDGTARQVYEAALQGMVPAGLSQATIKRAHSQLRNLGVMNADGTCDASKAELVQRATRSLKTEMP